jgi:hypothetical protein
LTAIIGCAMVAGVEVLGTPAITSARGPSSGLSSHARKPPRQLASPPTIARRCLRPGEVRSP